jgi:hypothetical protein
VRRRAPLLGEDNEILSRKEDGADASDRVGVGKEA